MRVEGLTGKLEAIEHTPASDAGRVEGLTFNGLKDRQYIRVYLHKYIILS